MLSPGLRQAGCFNNAGVACPADSAFASPSGRLPKPLHQNKACKGLIYIEEALTGIRLLWHPPSHRGLYYGGRAPRSRFSDWPAQRKTIKKKGRPLKIFIRRSKLQARISDENHHTDTCACPRPLPLHPRLLSYIEPIAQNMWLWAWDALPRGLLAIVGGNHHQKCQLVIWNGG
jgi:hypothetical protein